jgi:hypothetical protein
MREHALLLLRDRSRFDRTVGVGSGGRWAHRLRIDGGLVTGHQLAFLACGDVGLSGRCLRIVGVRHSTKRAATGSMTDGGLGPTLVLEGHSGAVAEVLLELVAVGVLGVVERGASVRQPALTPGLSGVLVLGRTELAGGLGLLLERLLLGGVGVADLDLELLGGGLDGVVVESSDDFFTSITVLEATRRSAWITGGRRTATMAYRAKPTPRPRPCLSRRMRAEQTLWGAKRFPSACSFMVLGRLETYRLVFCSSANVLSFE